MSATDGKVLLTVLWQRTSERGVEYLSGFLAKARIVGFKGEPSADGTPTWNLFIAPGRDQQEGGGRHPPREPAPPRPTPAPATSSSPIRPSRGVERWQRPQAEKPTEGPPFFDDPADDIGHDR
jgi:hypothetical protein